MRKRYYFLINGFSFECDEMQVLNYLSTFNPECRCIMSYGINGKERYFETVEEALRYVTKMYEKEALYSESRKDIYELALQS